MYVKHANFYPKDSKYFIKTELYVVPKDENMTIITHNIDGGRVSKTYEQMSKEDKSGVVLKLIIQENNSIRNVGQTMIEGCRDLLIKFSEDGLLFAYYNIEENQLKVYEIDDNIEGLIKKIQNEVSHLMEYQVEYGVD